MDLAAYRDAIKLALTGQVLELELNDSTLDSIINNSLRELQRYIASTKIITIPYSKCINMNEYKCSSVSRVFRTEGYMGEGDAGIADPMYMSAWQMFAGPGNMYNMQNFTYNFGAWNTALQIRNTLSTDLIFRFDRDSGNLYINTAFDEPTDITIEYVPRYDSVEEIKSDYWIDQLVQLSTAQAKVIVGRVRSRFKQSNTLWEQDGDSILAEGNNELAAIREHLRNNTQLVYGID